MTLALRQRPLARVVMCIVKSANGAWFDPSDLSTLYQDAAGTIPVTAVEQPVGLMLDKSRGLMLGPELVSNGTFDSSSAWVVAGGWAISVGAATNTAGVGANLTQSNIVVAKKFYQLTYTVTVIAGGLAPNIGGTDGISRTTSGTRTEIIVAGTLHSDLRFWASSSFSGSIDNISVKELYGYHATQSITASRPTLSARYNLLTKTDNLADISWLAAGVSLSPVADGHKLTPSVTNINHSFYKDLTIPINTSVVAEVKVKANGYTKARLICFNPQTPYQQFYAIIDLTTMTAAGYQSSGGTLSWVDFKSYTDGYLRIAICGYIGSVTTLRYQIDVLDSGGNVNFAGDGLSGITVKEPQLVIGTTSGHYQRVNTATDYDTDERYFKNYLRFDGIDDYLNLPYMGLYANGSASVVMARDMITTSSVYGVTEGSTLSNAQFYVFDYRGSISSGVWVRNDASVEIINTLSANGNVVSNNTIVSYVDTGVSVARFNNSQLVDYDAYSRAGNLTLNSTTIGALARPSVTGFTPLKLYGLIIAKSALTDSQRVACERFEARKSGVLM